ncbi:hypothetical protein B0H14DRAFT_3496970 [Mycena olivaceomarginata]|nr:hypothetical protein B0H14DRAFT_3496970 [Mycena olivaceomarginata]
MTAIPCSRALVLLTLTLTLSPITISPILTLSLYSRGISHIRLIDFDYVTLSSLNRHATAALADVGTPKKLCPALPSSILAAAANDCIPTVLKMGGQEAGDHGTFIRRMDLLFGMTTRNEDDRLINIRRGRWGIEHVVKYLESIGWRTSGIDLLLPNVKMTQLRDELNFIIANPNTIESLRRTHMNHAVAFGACASYGSTRQIMTQMAVIWLLKPYARYFCARPESHKMAPMAPAQTG